MATTSFSKTVRREWISFLVILWMAISMQNVAFADEEETTNSTIAEASDSSPTDHHPEGDDHLTAEEHAEEPAFAVLYPSFIMTLGVFTFYLGSRYLHFFPYTAAMFIIGTLIGVGVSVGDKETHVSQTVRAWQSINSEVLLLVFLPGLIFKDALGQNVHLFSIAIGQLLIFAFPCVLAGTVLTALVGFYIFPYGWSFNLAMTFGSILSATDPVAVAALLEEVGAPPRLKTHVSGESLLNDGAAIVFFAIFSEKFYYELGIEGFGEDVDAAEGVRQFCQKALGGAAFGIIFGIGTLWILYELDRRFSREENVVQVTAVVGLAYLGYYVSEFVAHTSGVIATVVSGLLVRFLGRASINDIHLMDDFFVLLEHILNTILFSLGGLVWGGVIVENHRDGIWRARDWGLLILLYVLLHVIRALLFVTTFPITKRIGLSTSWQETVFQVYGGLRGAVGIALALALDNEVFEVTGGDDLTKFEIWTTQVYQMVGGIAFMTLIINGTFAGPLLKKLGLADKSEIRHKMIEAYRIRFRQVQIDDFVNLLTLTRFNRVDFGLVKFHVPYLADLTLEQLVDAVEKLKETTQKDKYRPPQLDRVVPYLVGDGEGDKELEERLDAALLRGGKHEKVTRSQTIEGRRNRRAGRRERRQSSTMKFMMTGEPFSTQEMRLLFISMLKAQYEYQINAGELDSQHLLTVSLEQSIEEAETDVLAGKPLNDFQYMRELHVTSKKFVAWMKHYSCGMCFSSKAGARYRMNLNSKLESAYVEQAMAFTAAHKRAQWFFQEQLGDIDSDLSEAGKIVLQESNHMIELAQKDLNEKLDKDIVRRAVSHKFCKILLTKGIQNIEKMVSHGVLKESEAEDIVAELEELLEHVITCDKSKHEGQMDEEEMHLVDDHNLVCSLLPSKGFSPFEEGDQEPESKAFQEEQSPITE